MFFSLINVRSGHVGLRHSSIEAIGLAGINWSNITTYYHINSDARSYALDFHDVNISTSFNNLRQFGFSVRCLGY